MAGFAIPQSVNYPSPLHANQSTMQDEPKNGRMQIAAYVDWNVMGGTAKCVSFNVQDGRTKDFEQVSCLKVDNSKSGADIIFIWPDVQDTITIPARTPFAIVPVLSNSLQFYVSGPKALAGDITSFQLLNYPVAPSDIPATVESQAAVNGGTVITGGGGGPIQIIPAGISGTLESIKIEGSQPAAGAWQTSMGIVDGTGGILLAGWNVAADAVSVARSFILFDADTLNWRFRNGLIATFVPAGGAGSFIVNCFASYVL